MEPISRWAYLTCLGFDFFPDDSVALEELRNLQVSKKDSNARSEIWNELKNHIIDRKNSCASVTFKLASPPKALCIYDQQLWFSYKLLLSVGTYKCQ